MSGVPALGCPRPPHLPRSPQLPARPQTAPPRANSNDMNAAFMSL